LRAVGGTGGGLAADDEADGGIAGSPFATAGRSFARWFAFAIAVTASRAVLRTVSSVSSIAADFSAGRDAL
jgi:hypothetical protein